MTLMFLFYLRFVATDLGRDHHAAYMQWMDMEELIKHGDLNEYWRYGLAMELSKKELLMH